MLATSVPSDLPANALRSERRISHAARSSIADASESFTPALIREACCAADPLLRCSKWILILFPLAMLGVCLCYEATDQLICGGGLNSSDCVETALPLDVRRPLRPAVWPA